MGASDVVLLSVPFEGLRATAESLRSELAGRLAVSIVAPMEFVDGQMRAVGVPEGSAGELARDLLPGSRVASAFQNLSARELLRAEHPLQGDVAVCADDDGARQETMELASELTALRPIDAGPLSNSRYVGGVDRVAGEHQPHPQGAQHGSVPGDLSAFRRGFIAAMLTLT